LWGLEEHRLLGAALRDETKRLDIIGVDGFLRDMKI